MSPFFCTKRANERTRTADLLITSELLYHLSYVGMGQLGWHKRPVT